MLGYSIGLRALLASQRSLDIVGQNLANYATEGYSRQSVELLSSAPLLRVGVGSFGTGVTTGDVTRAHDRLLEARMRTQQGSLLRLQEQSTWVSAVEGYLQEPSEAGLSSLFGALFAGFSGLSGQPDEPSARVELVDHLQAVADGLRTLGGRVRGAGDEARRAIEQGVGEVNALLGELAATNRAILASGRQGVIPPELLDQQDRLARDLAGWVDVDIQRRADGSVDALLQGRLVVTGDRAEQLEAVFQTGTSGDRVLTVRRRGVDESLQVTTGRLSGLQSFETGFVPEQFAALDELTRALILELNRVHTTGVPGNGGYQSLVSDVGVGDASNRSLDRLELPFDVTAGELTVNVVATATGQLTTNRIRIDPRADTLETLANELSQIDHVNASVDSLGRLRIDADRGFTFDFAARLDAQPDDAGTFGGAAATLSGSRGPYTLTDGAELTVAVDGGVAQTVRFDAADFVTLSAATAAEVAAAIEAQTTGVRAFEQDGRVVVQSLTSGSASQLQLTDVSGSPTAALGLSTAIETGTEAPVAIELARDGESVLEGEFTVRVRNDGTVGVTPGLQLEVIDADGATVSLVNVGEGYTPDEPIELIPGVTISLAAGELSATSGDFFGFDVAADGDTSDVLVALGLGTLLTGSGVADVDVSDRVADDSDWLAGGLSGAHDGANFLRLLGVQTNDAEGLGGRTLEQAYSDVVARIGREAASTESSLRAEQLIATSLEVQRLEVAGVNLDREALKLAELEQLYSAALSYLDTLQDLNDELLALV